MTVSRVGVSSARRLGWSPSVAVLDHSASRLNQTNDRWIVNYQRLLACAHTLFSETSWSSHWVR